MRTSIARMALVVTVAVVLAACATGTPDDPPTAPSRSVARELVSPGSNSTTSTPTPAPTARSTPTRRSRSRLLVDRAHRAGLVVAQKNAVDLARRGRDDAGFDFAITEECDRYDESSAASDVYESSVLDIEYTDNLRGSFDAVCPRTPVHTILRDRALVPAGTRGHVYAHC